MARLEEIEEEGENLSSGSERGDGVNIQTSEGSNDPDSDFCVEVDDVSDDSDADGDNDDADEGDGRGEDVMDRLDYEVEFSVSQFRDELIIRGNVIPESDDDASDDELVRRDRRIRRGNPLNKLALGKGFFTRAELMEVVLDYAMAERKNVQRARWDRKKISFICGLRKKHDCLWRIYASYDEAKQMWIIKTTISDHTCTPNGRCKLLKSGVIAKLFLEKLRQNPDFYPKLIQNHIKEQWKFVSSRNKCQTVI